MTVPAIPRALTAVCALAAVLVCAAGTHLHAQHRTQVTAVAADPPSASRDVEPAPAAGGGAAAVAVPGDYIIGPEDILSVVFWREKDLSADVVVRPDGKISLPMLNDVQAEGLTPQQLADVVEKAAVKYVRDPGATVMVKEIRSRKIYVVGEVAKPGEYPMGSDMNVLQALAEAGGLLEHANRRNVAVVRKQKGGEQRFTFNYNDVIRGRNTDQNIQLRPGDTILVR
jgi:polysaccharide export outer membrane protein